MEVDSCKLFIYLFIKPHNVFRIVISYLIDNNYFNQIKLDLWGQKLFGIMNDSVGQKK